MIIYQAEYLDRSGDKCLYHFAKQSDAKKDVEVNSDKNLGYADVTKLNIKTKADMINALNRVADDLLGH